MATHSIVLAWRIPGTGEPGGLPSMGSHRVGHDWSNFAAAVAAGSLTGEGNGNPLQYSCLENPMDRGAWRAAVFRVAQSWTQLKRLSSSSSRKDVKNIPPRERKPRFEVWFCPQKSSSNNVCRLPGFLLPTYKIWGNERFKITSLRVWTFGRRLAIEPNSFFPPLQVFHFSTTMT